MAQEVQRVRYFTGEFLQEADFNGEQAYHIRMRYLHNRWLHTVGIATGLEVTAGPGALQVTVSPGMATVMVTETRIPEFQGDSVAKELVRIAPTVVNLVGPGNAQLFVVASFDEQQAVPVGTGNTRWLERPDIRALPAGSPTPDNQTTLILARVTLNAGGTGIASVDGSDRRGTGVRGEVEATQVRLPVSGVPNAAQWPSLRGGAANRLDVAGTLNLTSGNVTLTGAATVDGRDVSADGAALDAHVASTAVHVTGGNAHDHTGGNGAPIPWSAVTGTPDFLVKAFASIIGATAALGPRVMNVLSVVRTPAVPAGSFDVTFTAVTNPIFLLFAQASENVIWRISSSSSTTATLVVTRPDGTFVNPTRLYFVVL